ncbi:MAG: site-specific DNA-methyltransferase, partial [Anaerolineae bacterium]
NVLVFDKEHYAEPSTVLHLATECTNRNHSAAFPVPLPTWFIKLFTQPRDTVLDPFIGSGTTAVAAKQLGRYYIGVDIDEEYCQLARKRVMGIQPRLLEEPATYEARIYNEPTTLG